MTTAKKNVKNFILQGDMAKGEYGKGYYGKLILLIKMSCINIFNDTHSMLS